MADANPFIPNLATVKGVVDLTPDTKLFAVELDDPAVRQSFDYRPGQFVIVSAFGEGEAPFGITSLAYKSRYIEFAAKLMGTVTRALHHLEPGDAVGLRGPFGNGFPLEEYRGKNVLIIGGGIGMAPLVPVIGTILDRRGDYGKLTIVNGARTPQDLVFQPDFDAWRKSPGTELVLTVDRGTGDWPGRVALVPDVVRELNPSPENTIAITCGPPIMIHFTLAALELLGFSHDQIVTTLENKMKCGLGKCVRCNVGDRYICRDGPVFTFEEISHFIERF